MKTINKFLILTVATLALSVGAVTSAQTTDTAASKTRQRLVAKSAESDKTNAQEVAAKPVKSARNEVDPKDQDGETKTTDDVVVAGPEETKSSTPSDVPADAQANRHEQPSEEAAVVPYYNNFFNTYRLGPEDIISVSVFGQDRYSRAGIMIPPSGRISLALIPGGVFVNGKTVDEVAETIKKKYDEYIIDPQISVSLDKASSYRYSVIGDVGQPGIRLMSHRMTVTEAIGEAGGVLSTGDRSKVVVLRRQADGNLKSIPVNVSAIYKGKAPDTTYLVPGDQVIVPGNKLKSLQKIMNFFPILSFARVFAGGGLF
jgi:polysaccharide biosynthesis/export protein